MMTINFEEERVMKVSDAGLRRSDILRNGKASSEPRLDAGAVCSWQRKIGYFSLFAGVTAILGSQTQDISAAETEKAVPPRIQAKAAELLKKINGGTCSAPELLKRQSEYRLPGQKGNFNMVELLAGSDTCPGTAIPTGTYTAGAPYTDSGSTVGANNTVGTIPQACNGFYASVAGPDHIYSFQIGARGANPQIRATTTTGTYDLSIYILNGATGAMCPAGTGNNVTNCLVGSDNTLAPSAEVIDATQMNSLPLNTPLHLFIDSFYSAAGGSGAYTVTMQDVTVGGGPMPPANDAPVDFNGDGKSDFVMTRNVGGGPSGQVRWFPAYQDIGPAPTVDWGIASDEPVPADFDGDGKDDFAVYRPGATGTFYIIRSLTNTVHIEQFGIAGDDPTVVGDYDGDNRDDLAVYRSGVNPGNPSTWFYRSIGAPGGTFTAVTWGQTGDFPAPGDYDGDGRYDFVVQRADGANGRFWKRLSGGELSSELFGLNTDIIAPGDYDDDGKTDLAVVRDDGGNIRWSFEPSGTAGSTVVSDIWGVTATDVVAQGDYDGDGRTEFAVWRRGATGQFLMMALSTPRTITSSLQWGEVNDYPVANYNTH